MVPWEKLVGGEVGIVPAARSFTSAVTRGLTLACREASGMVLLALGMPALRGSSSLATWALWCPRTRPLCGLPVPAHQGPAFWSLPLALMWAGPAREVGEQMWALTRALCATLARGEVSWACSARWATPWGPAGPPPHARTGPRVPEEVAPGRAAGQTPAAVCQTSRSDPGWELRGPTWP